MTKMGEFQSTGLTYKKINSW